MEDQISVIPRIRKVAYTTYASFPSSNLKAGDLAYATDRLVFYRWSGSAWQSVTIHASSGAEASIPSAANLPNGSLYFETDTAKLKQVQSSSWAEITTSFTLQTKIMNLTRDMTAASGDVATTAVGFAPKALIIIGAIGGTTTISLGFGGGSNDEGCVRYYPHSSVWEGTGSHFVSAYETATKNQTSTIKTLDADGFTETYAKGGTPSAGTFSYQVLCIG